MKRNILILVLGFVLIGQIFPQSKNSLNNTTWESTNGNNIVFQFGENSFKYTTENGSGLVGTYEMKGDSITFRTQLVTFQGTLLGNTLTVGLLGYVIELYRVQPGANSQSNSKNNSGTQNKTAQDFLNSGYEYFEEGNNDRAIADYSQAIKLNPKYVDAYNNRGLAYMHKQDYDRAIADFNQAIKLAPNDSIAYNNRAFAYEGKGDYDRAIADYTQAIKLDPNDSIAYNNRAFAYKEKGDYDRAIADFNQVIKLEPDDINAYYLRGEAYLCKQDYDRAIEDFNQVIKLEPDDAYAYNGRGEAYYNKGDYDKAIADFNQAIRIYPDFNEAKLNLELAQRKRGR